MKNFCIKRVFLLIQKEFFENLKIVGIGFASIIGFVFAILMISGYNGGFMWHYFNEIFNTTLILGGIAIAGMAFSDFRGKERTITYLTLPASHLEKSFTQLLLTSVGFIISYTAVFYISYLMFLGLGKLLFTFDIGTFNPFNETTYKAIFNLIIIQSLFLAGASIFKRVPVFFTGLYIFIFSIVFMIIAGIMAYYLSQSFDAPGNGSIMFSSVNSDNITIDSLWTGKIFEIFFMYLLAPIFWAITYFNVREKEV